jgi:hypothetical protein
MGKTGLHLPASPACLTVAGLPLLSPCTALPGAALACRYVFPKGHKEWRSRVGVALGLLMASKVLNVQVGSVMPAGQSVAGGWRLRAGGGRVG